ncbi:Uncharacterized protein TCM_013978 [Theobroma cacao]|uniref:Uncharacterized protein n=1 Tax=Theobroma cacao TaxID=3641 RepID=A0A061FXQ0_THECC|nr:Uncharacterized protein TCM_013978 [Theobroma cacao]
MVHNFLASTLQGRISHLRHVSVEDLWMMETIESQFYVNIVEYMIMRMRQVAMREETTLPYGNIISTLVKKKGIWSNRYLADWTSRRPRTLSFRWLVKRGYDLSLDEPLNSVESSSVHPAHDTPSRQPSRVPVSNDVMYNMLLRIDEKLRFRVFNLIFCYDGAWG